MSDFTSYTKLLLSYNSRPILARLGSQEIVPVTLNLAYGDQTARFSISRKSDFTVLAEVFGRREYDIGPIDPAVRTIVDLGSNTGISPLFFFLKYPNATIHAVEADPQTYEILRFNLRDFARIQTHHLAITASDGAVVFYRDPRSSISSSLKNRHAQTEPVRVDGVCLDTLFARLDIKHVDILKFDIEGAEYDAFAAARCLGAIHQAVGELHPDLAGIPTARFLSLFEDRSTRLLRQFGSRAIVHIQPICGA